MSDYIGTETQVALQRKCVDQHARIMASRGAVQTARMCGTDDPDRYGWDRLAEALEEDGFVGFRLLRRDHLANVHAWVDKCGAQLDCWDVFTAEAATIAVRPDPKMPRDYTILRGPEAVERGLLPEIQSCMAAQGVAPMPAPFLRGDLGPCSLAAILDSDGRVVCTAFSHFPHNAHSPYRNWAWSGLVATMPEARGQGLAVAAHVAVLKGIVGAHGAERAYALARPENAASVRMLEKCGMTHMADRVSCMARLGAARLTR